MTLLAVGERKEWRYAGMNCALQKNDIGHWCGYVQTEHTVWQAPTCPPLSGHRPTGESAVYLLSAHGGITYGPDEEGWIGFDCGHSNDLCLDETGEPWGKLTEQDKEPMEVRRHGSVAACETAEECRVWRLGDVRDEVNHLAAQVTLLEQFAEAAEG